MKLLLLLCYVTHYNNILFYLWSFCCTECILPPSLLFSNLKIISPPPIPVVLKQLKELTVENRISLDNWTYVHGSPEDVFRSIFSFLEDNYDKLSPRIQSGLKDRAMIPVGSTLVKPSRLFFRLAKDLTPFFFEVPRAFGAYEKLLRELGVRETPRSHDYAVSLKELKGEIGDHRLNANELKSVIEVIRLIADVEKSANLMTIFLPDDRSALLPLKRLLRNDAPWILQKVKSNALHFVHPRVSEELCNQLKVPRISTSVTEHLEEGFKPQVVHKQIGCISHIERQIRSSVFGRALESMTPLKRPGRFKSLSQMTVLPVETLRTKFTVTAADGDKIDITLDPMASASLVDESRVFLVVERLPGGVTPELAVASS